VTYDIVLILRAK